MKKSWEEKYRKEFRREYFNILWPTVFICEEYRIEKKKEYQKSYQGKYMVTEILTA